MKPLIPIAFLALIPVPFFLRYQHHPDSGHGAAAAPQHEAPSQNPEESMKELIAGNLRHLAVRYGHPNQSIDRRQEVAAGQHPRAIVVGCADSRVPPELVFDQGFGDLFVVRVAGNVIDDPALGSIEYAAEHLHVPLIVVLGHERCGAVAATLKGGEVPGHIGSLVKAIRPAVEISKKEAGDALDNAVRAQIQLVSRQLRESKPILSEMVEKGNLWVVGARYDLDTGAVELISTGH